ncbi:MAG: 50S ribosomal protein L29 [Planctomycetota bacterium]|nr:50S ribosomal protein L29 [Planctomycetota bacterium]
MRTRDIRRREDNDLEQELVRLRQEIFKRRFHGQSEETVDPSALRKAKRDIARIKTILRERKLGIRTGADQEAK